MLQSSSGGGSVWSGGVLLGPGGGVVLLGPGGGFSLVPGGGGGSPWSRGGGFSLVPGGESPWSRGGLPGPGGILQRPPPPLWTESQTPVKT